MSEKKKQITELKIKETIKRITIQRNKKKKYILVFLLKEQNTYEIRKKKRFNPINNKIKYKKKLYIIDTSKPTFTRKQKLFYAIDIDIGQLYFPNNTKVNINEVKDDKKFRDLMMGTDLIEKLSSGLLEKVNIKNIFEKILYIGFGIAIGFIIGMML